MNEDFKTSNIDRKILLPFDRCKGKSVEIYTWGVSDCDDMCIETSVMTKLEQALSVSLYVGFSKQASTKYDELLKKLLAYQAFPNFRVYAVWNMHAKIWMIGDKTWVGSANFTQPTIANIMVPVKRSQVFDFVRKAHKVATPVTPDIKFMYCKQIEFDDDEHPIGD